MISEGMPWEESIAKEKEYRKQAKVLLAKADDLKYERIRMSAASTLAQADFVKKRGTEPHPFQPRFVDDGCDWCGRKADDARHQK